MQDIAGCRVVVENVRSQNSVVEQLASILPGSKTVDRRQKPSHGYRAVHVIASIRSIRVEIQIRTKLQDLWANISERFADRSSQEIKYGRGPEHLQEILMKLSDWIADLEEDEIAFLRGGLRNTSGTYLSHIDSTNTKIAAIFQQLIEKLDSLRKHP